MLDAKRNVVLHDANAQVSGNCGTSKQQIADNTTYYFIDTYRVYDYTTAGTAKKHMKHCATHKWGKH